MSITTNNDSLSKTTSNGKLYADISVNNNCIREVRTSNDDKISSASPTVNEDPGDISAILFGNDPQQYEDSEGDSDNNDRRSI